MGCVVSKAVPAVIDPSSISLRRKESVSISIPSTGGLQLILQQRSLRVNFHNFILYDWVPSEQCLVNSSKADVQEIALNCLSFWLDVRDYCKLRPSLFQIHRAGFLFEKYLMHGAVMQVVYFAKK